MDGKLRGTGGGSGREVEGKWIGSGWGLVRKWMGSGSEVDGK